ncbi:MAG: hypothetical protein JXB10_10285 [Pirellulales bacterium]|nr:hypothetical protein [Pirellulales bacterium]
MTQAQLNRAVSRATGESLSTITCRGFVPLTVGPMESERRPLVVDWDRLDALRPRYLPQRSRPRRTAA